MTAAPTRRSGFTSGSNDTDGASFRGLISLRAVEAPPEDPPREHRDGQRDEAEAEPPHARAAARTTPQTDTDDRGEPTPTSTQAPATKQETTSVVDGVNPWTVELPANVTAKNSRSAFRDLLEGPLETVPMVLPEPIANALQEYALQLAIAGTPVSKQTLVAHALAYAYGNQQEWVSAIPGDGRRRGAPKHLTHGARKTTFRLPVKLNEATLRLLLRTLRGREDNAASRLSLVSTALAFALNRADQWVADALQNPVR